MQPYEQYAGLGVHWMTFGNSGHKDRPVGGVLANYVSCMAADAPINRCSGRTPRPALGQQRGRPSPCPTLCPLPPCPTQNHPIAPRDPGRRHIKTIANTRYLTHIGLDPHTFSYTAGAPAVVNQDFAPIAGAVVNAMLPAHSKIALYHYLVKSDADFRAKMKRGSGDGGRKNSTLQNAVNQQSTHVCTFGIRLGLVCCPSTLEERRNQSVSLQQRRQRQL